MKCLFLSASLVLFLVTAHADTKDFESCETIDLPTKTTSLSDVNADCLLNIIKDFQLNELNSLRATNKYLSNIVKEDLRRRFAMKRIFLAGLQKISGSAIEYHDEIRIVGDVIAVQIIQEFSSTIRNLQISTAKSSNPIKVQEIFKLINVHCYTLNRLHLDYSVYNFFPSISRPFENVEILTLDFNVGDLKNNQYSFNELFPVLRRLELGGSFTARNINELDLKYPFLEHLSVKIRSASSENELLAKNIIRKNPQIQSITIGLLYLRMIRFIQDELPELKSLEIVDPQGYDDLGTQINFEHVESLSFKFSGVVHSGWPSNINFNNKLRDLNIMVDQYDEHFHKIIQNNQRLQELTIVARNGVSELATQELISAKLGVRRLAIEVIEIKTSIQLFESCKQLEQFDCTLFITYPNEADKFINEFKNRFENEWNINVLYKGSNFIKISSRKK